MYVYVWGGREAVALIATILKSNISITIKTRIRILVIPYIPYINTTTVIPHSIPLKTAPLPTTAATTATATATATATTTTTTTGRRGSWVHVFI